MTVQHSFSKIEKELLPAFRQQIGAAESTEDVKKFFVHTILDFVTKATGGELKPVYEDISLNHAGEVGDSQFNLSESITSHPVFRSIWETSDMRHIVGRFASSACNRHKHLEKNPGKTEAKIRM
jgi:hypothetical protein